MWPPPSTPPRVAGGSMCGSSHRRRGRATGSPPPAARRSGLSVLRLRRARAWWWARAADRSRSAWASRRSAPGARSAEATTPSGRAPSGRPCAVRPTTATRAGTRSRRSSRSSPAPEGAVRRVPTGSAGDGPPRTHHGGRHDDGVGILNLAVDPPADRIQLHLAGGGHAGPFDRRVEAPHGCGDEVRARRVARDQIRLEAEHTLYARTGPREQLPDGASDRRVAPVASRGLVDPLDRAGRRRSQRIRTRNGDVVLDDQDGPARPE